ncbi:MAG: esterase-like activity of phytase family protein [Proteobacteria bacterium]|nr:esterase-like activity of phytase family protein [Pseudomonadota bacterium]
MQRLIAVSDLGFLVHFKPHFHDGMLVGVSYCASHALRDAAGDALQGRWRDAEGLSLRPGPSPSEEQLLVSFEQRPRIQRYTLDGHLLGALPLPEDLRPPARYRHPNRALEAVTETRRYGVVTAPELPMAGQTGRGIPVTSLTGPSFEFHGLDERYSGLVGLETLPDDNLLVLERRYVSPFRPLIIALSRMTLPDQPAGAVRQRELARFDTTAGWAMDNFESVARHAGNRYFMVSDDNASPLQHGLLLYFEVLDDTAIAPGPEPAKPPLSRHRF